METPNPSPAPVLSYTHLPKPPKRNRINIRLIVFLSIVSLPFLVGIVYPIVNYQIHHGVEHHGDYDKVDLRALGFFTFDQVEGKIQDVPAQWRALDGKRVQLEGFTWDPRAAAGGMTEFQLVYNRTKCCFSGPPLVQERVFAYLPAGQAMPDIDYGQLTGILHVKIQKQNGIVVSIYTLEVQQAKPIG